MTPPQDKARASVRCPICGRITVKLYGGNGQMLAGCFGCWQKGLDLDITPPATQCKP